MTSLFNTGEFRLHSGATSSFKIDCDALTDDDLATLAIQIAARFRWRGTFGIPSGGTRFAHALARFNVPCSDLPRLIVDDVYTTGSSMAVERYRHHLPETPPAIGVVIFARSEPADWVHAIFKMWEAPMTPAFRSGAYNGTETP